jgi:hypothetical protein
MCRSLIETHFRLPEPCAASHPFGGIVGTGGYNAQVLGPAVSAATIPYEVVERLLDFVREAALQALYELGDADDYRLRLKELAEAQAMRGMDWPELP